MDERYTSTTARDDLPATMPLRTTARKPGICRRCGNTGNGWLRYDRDERGDVVRVGQYCDRCDGFHDWYRKEDLGLAQRSIRRDDKLGGSAWARALERHGYACVACHHTGRPLHQGHLISKAEGAAAGIPANVLDDEVNIAPFCETCNSGLGSHTAAIHLTYFCLRQAIDARDNAA